MVGLLAPSRKQLVVIGLTIVAGAGLEAWIPQLLTRQLRCEADRVPGARIDGVLDLALMYLVATGLSQAMNFLTTYLTAIASPGALRALRVRLFAHFQKLEMSYFD